MSLRRSAKSLLIGLGLALATSGTVAAQADPPNADERPLTVQEVGERRAELAGRRVVVEGFLERWSRFYLLLPGKRRPAQQVGENGERFWCYGDAGSKPLWLKSVQWGVAPKVPRIQPGWIPRGRLVTVTGVLDPSIATHEPSYELTTPLPEATMQDASYGPLREARVVAVKDEYCLSGEP